MRKYITDAFLSAGIYVLSAASGSYGRHILTREQADEIFSSYKSKFKIINGLRIHYRDEGRGEVIVLLHGFAASLHTWNLWAKDLQKDYRVIRLDIPGFGLSDSPAKHNISVAFFTNFLNTFLEELGVESCYLAGNSFGGWMSWEYALAEPQRVKKLILLNAAGYFTKDTQSKTVAYASKGLFKQLLKNGVPRFIIKRLVINAFADDYKVDDFTIDRYYGLANREGNLASIIKFAVNKPTVHTDKIKDIRQPTLVLWGAKDKVISYVDAYRFQDDIEDCELIIYEDVGHVPMMEAADRSLHDLRAFLAKK